MLEASVREVVEPLRQIQLPARSVELEEFEQHLPPVG